MTFNLRIPVEADGSNQWKYRKDAAASVIKSSNASVIGVQEARYEMLQEITERAPDLKWVGEGRRGGMDDELSAIFFDPKRVTLLEHETFWLSETPSIPGSQSWDSHLPRICTRASFQLVDEPSREFIVFNTHLDHIGEQARIKGLQVILNHIEGSNLTGKQAMVLMGDFNAEPTNPAIAQLNKEDSPFINSFQYFHERGIEAGNTFHNFEGGMHGKTIDYIFVTNHFLVEKTEIIREKVDGLFPSDHYPVQAILNFIDK